MTDLEKPKAMRVCCLNAPDGCTAVVVYMGVKPVRKLCPTCMECGMPSERVTAGHNLSKEIRTCKVTARVPDGFYDPAGPIVACTVHMKTQNGGRVLPCPAGRR